MEKKPRHFFVNLITIERRGKRFEVKMESLGSGGMELWSCGVLRCQLVKCNSGKQKAGLSFDKPALVLF